MSEFTIVGGKLRTLGIERPATDQIITLAAAAYADGFALAGSGPIRRVVGSTITVIVSDLGCTCPVWRSGTYCFHAAMLAVERLPVTLETAKPAPVSITRYHERRGYTRRPITRHLWPVRPVTPIRPRTVA